MLLEHRCGISGWHARPISEITAFVSENKLNAQATCKEKKANASSVVGLMSLNVKFGDVVSFDLCGQQETIERFEEFIKEF